MSAHEVTAGDRMPRGGPQASRALVPVALAAAVAVVAIALSAGAPVPTRPTAPGEALPAPRFAEEAFAAGIQHAYQGEYTFFVGGGVAAFDCDADLRPELYLAGGAEPAALFRNRTKAGAALRFERMTDPITDLTSVTGAYPIDIDADRLVDLVILRRGENVILRGRGDCRFERADEALGFAGGDAWTVGFSATWETPAALLPTLAFGEYVTLDDQESAVGCPDNQLLRPADDGSGYGPPIPLSPGWCTLSLLFSDWDRSGRRDLRVSNDRHYYRGGEEQLWRIEAGEPPRAYGREDGWARLQIWGMGIASHDLTGDGYPEVYLTSQADNKLQTLADGPARPIYEDIALRRGATAHRPFVGDVALPSTAWHAEFDDVNTDGFVDLFVAKGNVDAMAEFAMKDPSNLLLGQPDGTFVEAAEAAGLLSYARARGATLTDLDLDGLPDLVVVNRRENVKVYRNLGSGTAAAPAAMGGWIQLRLIQDGPNRDAIGSWVEVKLGDRTSTREVTVGGGHAGGELGWIHVGVGPAKRVQVRVRWPDGEVGPWLSMDADRFAVIERGADEIALWSPTP